MKLTKVTSKVIIGIGNNQDKYNGYKLSKKIGVTYHGMNKKIIELTNENIITRTAVDNRQFKLRLTSKGQIAYDLLVRLIEVDLKC